MNMDDQVRRQIWEPVRGRTGFEIYYEVLRQFQPYVQDQVWDQVWEQVGVQVWNQVRDQVCDGMEANDGH
jgi:hypothetical protein